MSKEIYDFSLADLLPGSITGDESMSLIISALDSQISAFVQEINRLMIYPSIDTQPHDVLNILAWQFNLTSFDGWNTSMPIEQKREFIKNALELHRYKGTRWAVEKALEIIGHNTELYEWFEYSGEPYHFRVIVDSESAVLTAEELQKLTSYISAFKNIRSHMDTIEVNSVVSSPIYIAAALYDVDTTIVWPE
ncbi:phage tail protein I [Geovibrio ferrireducens]|uniref:phage tail protein I n=1 Tax=Geovibrio ferrireducens TaxID=46201 RepID=UPI00224581A4|nr:phage tail protein I [Geovibrio ferrireducens]